MHKVLVVDDHVDVAPMLAGLIIAMGHEARCARSCEEALPIAQEFRPDTALIDISMPTIDGFECARLLREQVSKKLRLFGMSGYSFQSWREKPAIFEKYLLKPVQSKTLTEILAG